MKLLLTTLPLLLLFPHVAEAQAGRPYTPKPQWQYCVASVSATLPPHFLLGNDNKYVRVYSLLFRGSEDLSHPWGNYLNQQFQQLRGTYTVTSASCEQGINPGNNPHEVAQTERNQLRSDTQGLDNPTQIYPFPGKAEGFTLKQDLYGPTMSELDYSDLRSDECGYIYSNYLFPPDGPGNPNCFPSLNHAIPDATEKTDSKMAPYVHKNQYDPKATLDPTARPSNPDPHPISPKKLPEGCRYTDSTSSEVTCE